MGAASTVIVMAVPAAMSASPISAQISRPTISTTNVSSRQMA